MKRLALIGRNIGYSLSPRLHELIAHSLGEDISYQLLDFEMNQMPKMIAMLQSDFIGFNVTTPYKNAVIPYLSGSTSASGAVNCVSCDGMIGHNTDGQALVEVMSAKIELEGANVLILGAGGMAQAAAHSLVSSNANVCIWARKHGEAQQLAQRANACVFNEDFLPDAVISCVSEDIGVPLQVNLGNTRLLLDAKYTQSQQFFSSCQPAIAINGIELLIHQALLSAQIFYQRKLTKLQKDGIVCEAGKILGAINAEKNR